MKTFATSCKKRTWRQCLHQLVLTELLCATVDAFYEFIHVMVTQLSALP